MRRAPIIPVALMFAVGVAGILAVAAAADPPVNRELGYGQVRFNGHGPEWWAAKWRQERRRSNDLQRRLTVRVLEVRGLRRTLLAQPSSLTALKLAAVAYDVSFDTLHAKARCESGRSLYARAKNPTSTASGLMQFLDSTWASTPYAGFDVFDPYANALAGGWMHKVGRGGEWAASSRCHGR